MKFKFEKLLIWQRAMDFGERIDALAGKFPKYEMFNLSLQIRKAGDSVALNISEGAIGQSNAEQSRFMGYGIRSLAETVTCLYKAKRRNYISDDEFASNYGEAYNLMNMMVAFKNNMK
ncbi:four helix bundle protein [Litoribacter ruber]|uniref:four helix bundle protein n=1 Tax=Litoribacter ruber TaxID=702568 RepID=UPI001BDA28D3|nr:four helix bundle protein [Litoribacter ruber]MBT0811281.1 four helix bundle protein [Litoribacter ruber]